MTVAVEIDEGDDAVILLGHATGFCKEVWRPVTAELRAGGCRATILAWDARGHGASPPLQPPVSWWTFGEDVVELLSGLGERPVVGVGHSMSGAALVMGEVTRPQSFRGLVLVEPVIIPPPFRRDGEFPLAVGARKRRPSFESREAAAARFRAKPVFARWHPDAFSGYVEGGLRDAENGVVLSCPPEVEAAVFEGSAESGVFARVGECEVPVRLVVTDHPGEGLQPAMVRLTDEFPNGTTSFLTGQNHLVVMERPDLVAAEILEMVEEVLSPST